MAYIGQKKDFSIKDILISKPKYVEKINKSRREALGIWENFLNHLPDKKEIISPLWSMEFGATYPFENTTPFALGTKKLKKYKGSFGKDLSKLKDEEVFEHIPLTHYSNRKNEQTQKN